MLKRFRTFFFTTIFLYAGIASATGSGITYHGRIMKPDGHALEGSNVQFRLQLRTPGNENCLLYEEIQSLDMRDSAGIFALTINDTAGVRTDSTGYTLDRIFGNRETFSVTSSNCVSGVGTTTNWSPNESDGRKLQVYFKDETLTNWEPLPSSMINFVPMAIEAKQLQGYGPRNFLRFDNATAADAASAVELTLADFNDLLDLIAGTSTKYTKAGQLNGAALPSLTGGQAVRWNGSAWQAYTPMTSADETDPSVKGFAKANLPVCGANEFLSASGINTWSCVAVSGSAGGTVTSIVGGTGLTGGTITSTGTFAVDVGTTANKIVQLDGTAKLPAVDGSALTNITGANILGTIDGSVAIDTTGDIETTGNMAADDITATGNLTAAGVSTTTVAVKTLELYKPNNAFKTTIIPLSTLAADYTLTLPPDDGAANQVLQTNGSGVLTWATPLTSGTLPVATTGVQGIMQVGTGLAVTTGTVSADFGSTTGKVVEGDDDRLNPAPVIGDALKIPRVTSGGIAYENVTAATVVTSGGGVVNGGNTLGAALTVGTNDSQSLAFETNNATAMTILDGGKVGIGVTNPHTALHVAASNGKITIGDTSEATGATAGVQFRSTAQSAGYTKGAIYFENTGAGNGRGMMHFALNGVASATSVTTTNAIMTLRDSGNVGIGTTTPTVALDVGAKTDAIHVPTGTDAQRPGTPANGMIRYNSDNSKLEAYIAGGWKDLAAAATGGSYLATTGGTLSGAVTVPTLYGSAASGGDITIDSTSDGTKGDILLAPNGGKVGIGTATPGSKLDVASTGGTDTLAANFSGTGTGLTYLDVRSDNATDSSGSVIRLISKDVADTGVSSVDLVKYNNGLFAISNNETNAAATTVFNIGGTEKMRIASSGSVGIGTNSPTSKLHISSASTTTGNPGLYSSTTFSPTANNAVDLWNMNNIVSYDSTFNGNRLIGMHSVARNTLSGNVAQLMGVVGAADPYGTGTVADAVGVYGRTGNFNTGTVTSAKGLFSTVVNPGGGAITTGYGLYIDAVQATNKYSIYSSDATAPSFLAGNLGVGTATTPGATLHVKKDASSVGSIAVEAGSPEIYFKDVDETGIFRLVHGAAGLHVQHGTGSIASPTWSAPAITVTPTGAVGIGTSAPAPFVRTEIQATGTTTSADWVHNLYAPFYVNPAANSAAVFAGTANVTYTNTANSLNLAVGGRNIVHTLSTGTISGAIGGDNLVYLASGSTITTADGSVNYVSVNNAGATVSNARGGTFAINRAAGTITNGYGVYIGEVNATNKWGLYQSDAIVPNYFAGNVGIGTTNPSKALSIEKEVLIRGNNAGGVEYNDWPESSFAIRRSDDFVLSGITMMSFGYRSDPTYVTDDSVANIRIWDPTQGASATTSAATTILRMGSRGPMGFGTGNVQDRMFINASGNVGVGTTSPDGSLKIVTASAQTNSPSTGIFMGKSAGGDYQVQITQSGGLPHFDFSRGTNIDYDGRILSPADGALAFVTAAGGEVMRLTGGNVGVGTTAPEQKLHVISASAGAPQIMLDNATNARMSMYAHTGAYGAIEAYNLANSAKLPLALNPWGGNVGIGTNAPDEKFVVYNGTTTGKYTTGGWTHASDRRLKHDILPIENSLDKVLKLRGVEYKFNQDPSNRTQVGFIAQEVEPIFPEVVETDSKGFKSMIYANLVAPIVESIKALFHISEEQSREIASVKAENEKLKQENAAIKSYICAKDPSAPLCQ